MKDFRQIFLCLLALGLLATSCGSNPVVKPVCGTLDSLVVDTLQADSITVIQADTTQPGNYDVQQALCSHLGYAIEGETITFYIDGKAVRTVTNTLTDMGGFDEDAVWIGERMVVEKHLSGYSVRVVPGVKYVTGLALHYENMPTFTADVMLSEDGSLQLENLR